MIANQNSYVPISVGNCIPHKGFKHLFQISVCPFTQICLKIIWRGTSYSFWQNCYWKSKINALCLTVLLRGGCFQKYPYCNLRVGYITVPQLGTGNFEHFFPKLHLYFITDKMSFVMPYYSVIFLLVSSLLLKPWRLICSFLSVTCDTGRFSSSGCFLCQPSGIWKQLLLWY